MSYNYLPHKSRRMNHTYCNFNIHFSEVILNFSTTNVLRIIVKVSKDFHIVLFILPIDPCSHYVDHHFILSTSWHIIDFILIFFLRPWLPTRKNKLIMNLFRAFYPLRKLTSSLRWLSEESHWRLCAISIRRLRWPQNHPQHPPSSRPLSPRKLMSLMDQTRTMKMTKTTIELSYMPNERHEVVGIGRHNWERANYRRTDDATTA